jgi:anti-anti-sigma factor
MADMAYRTEEHGTPPALRSARELEAARGPAVQAVSNGPGWTLAVLRGEIDLYNVDSVREIVERNCIGEQEQVVLELSSVESIDPVALRVLLTSQRRLGWESLIALAPSPSVRRALEASGLDSVVRIHESFESIAAAGKPA